MTTLTQPNLLLEALTYLGRIANGHSLPYMEHRIRQRKIKPSYDFSHTFALLKELAAELEKNLSPTDEGLMELFTNLEGFPHNTIGSASTAFLLFYPLLDHFNGNPESLSEEVESMTADDVACSIADILNLSDTVISPDSFQEHDLVNLLLPLSIPDKSKITLLNICHNYHKLFRDVSRLLFPVIEILKTQTEKIRLLSGNFLDLIAESGSRIYLEETSHLVFSENIQYTIRPFLFGMDTILTSEPSGDSVDVYCGILRGELLSMLNETSNSHDDIFEAYRLLGDRTRFDILRYLCGHDAYGLELSEQFSLSRNTIHHHMNRLTAGGLVSCRTDGNRTYYTLNKTAFAALLRHQEELFGLSTQ